MMMMGMMRRRMMRVTLLVLALTAACDGILPELVTSGVSHILEEDGAGQTEPVEQVPGDAGSQLTDSESIIISPDPINLPPDHHNESVSDNERDDQETSNITTRTVQYSDLEVCITDEDCGKGRYCIHDKHNSRCTPCKAVDMSCTRDVECCGEQLCIWGQCSQNATKGEAGSTCQYQSDCRPDLCCGLHQALRFAICLAKPIERERCFGASNHLMELLSWDVQDQGPRKHCPCAGDLHCQHLGRGSMCLKGEDSSEEDLTDTLYSEIDYII